MTARNRRLAIALFLALAVHAGLIAAVTQARLTPDISADRFITVTLTTSATNRPIDSHVLAQQAQFGQAPYSRRGFKQATPATRDSQSLAQLAARQVEHLQRITPRGDEQLTTRKTPRPPGTQANAHPKRTRMTRSARRDPRAAYLDAWRRRVEYYGNRHYPGALIARAPRPRLTLVVTLSANGRVQGIRIAESSGSTALDQAARAIVRQAGPYPPFPEKLRQRTSQLTFAYDWVFGG